jgi:hypothetical protein
MLHARADDGNYVLFPGMPRMRRSGDGDDGQEIAMGVLMS